MPRWRSALFEAAPHTMRRCLRMRVPRKPQLHRLPSVNSSSAVPGQFPQVKTALPSVAGQTPVAIFSRLAKAAWSRAATQGCHNFLLRSRCAFRDRAPAASAMRPCCSLGTAPRWSSVNLVAVLGHTPVSCSSVPTPCRLQVQACQAAYSVALQLLAALDPSTGGREAEAPAHRSAFRRWQPGTAALLTSLCLAPP